MYSSSLDSWTDPNDLDNLVPQQAPQLGTSVLQGHMRKVRHIQGIALRNLNITPLTSNFGSLSSPLGTTNGTGARKSSITSLMSPTDKYRRRSSIDSLDNVDPDSPVRPRRPRRNTRDQPPQVIRELQNVLQELNTSHLLDSVVVLHAPEQLEPIYISEVIKESMNPEFKEVDLSELRCRNSHTINLTVYGKTRGQPTFRRLFSHDTKLDQLRFIGRSLDLIDFSFPTNSFILNLSDGWYVSPDVHVTAYSLTNSLTVSRDETAAFVTSCSFDTIMKLNNLEECIIDAEVTKTAISRNIQSRLDQKNNLTVLTNQRSQIQNRKRQIFEQISAEKRRMKQLFSQKQEVQFQLQSRKKIIGEGKHNQDVVRQDIERSKGTIGSQLDDTSRFETSIAAEQARVANSLINLFPIELIDQKKYIFSICELPLQPAINDQNEEEVGAVFGYISQLVYYLSNYLNIPLRYPLQPFGSQSFIIDPISDIQGSRTFPLWTKGSLYYRFEYGLYLLHKDIEQLINSQALPVVDWKQTLGNLKNLLLVISTPTQNKLLPSN
jgi:UV radiation resistance-associated gene protein